MSDIQIDKKILLSNGAENLEPFIITDPTLSTESSNIVQNAPVANKFRDILYFEVVQSNSIFRLIDLDVDNIKQNYMGENDFYEFNGIQANGILINPNIIEANEVSITYDLKYVKNRYFYRPIILTSTLDGTLTESTGATHSTNPAATYLPRFEDFARYFYPNKQNAIKQSYSATNVLIRINIELNKVTGTNFYEAIFVDTGEVFCGVDNKTSNKNRNRPTSMDSGFTCWRIGGDPTHYELKNGEKAEDIQINFSSLVVTVDSQSYRFVDYINSL